MTLYSTIEKRMKEDLETLQGNLDAQKTEVEAELRTKLKGEQRMYKEMVDDVIDQRVNSETYAFKQDAYFNSMQHTADSIEQAYRNVLPKLLTHKMFTDQVAQFLSGAESATEITVSGQYAKECAAALEKAGHTAVKVQESSEELGYMTYTEGSRKAELSLAEFLNDVKKKTIQYVSSALKNV